MRIVAHQAPMGGVYSEWRPPHLARWVELIWHFEGPSQHIGKRVFPNGRVELLVNFGAPYRMIDCPGLEWLNAAVLSGVLSRPCLIEQPPHQNLLALRLRPAGAYSLIARPLSEVSDLSIDLEDVVGRAAAELAERCHDARTLEERFRRAADWLERRVAGAIAVEPAIAWVAAEVERSGGAASIADMRDATGLTKTRLATAFREQIGVTPKLYARLVRFRRATALLRDTPQRFVDVALEAGYYDQPHMNAEFRALSGLTPKQYVATCHRVAGGVTGFVA